MMFIMRAGKHVAIKSGFSLLELMIVLVIISLLLLLAYPNYQRYLKKQNRLSAYAEIIEVAAKIERETLFIRNYEKAVDNLFTLPINIPSDSKVTTYRLSIKADSKTYTIIAKPEALQVGDGRLTYQSSGKRCWYQYFDDSGGECKSW